jgi:hypothetical protein
MKKPVYSKVKASALGGAIVLVAVWIVGLLGLNVPGEVAAALTTIVSTLLGWLVPERVQ